MDGNTTRDANLRAIQRLLDYAALETRRAGLSEVGKLLSTAQLIIGSTLGAGPCREAMRTETPRPSKIRLVACRDTHYKKESETKI
jgi:hypothetical protein